MRFLCRFLRKKSRRLAFYIKRAFSATRRQMQVLKCSKFQIAGFEQQRMLFTFYHITYQIKTSVFSFSIDSHNLSSHIKLNDKIIDYRLKIIIYCRVSGMPQIRRDSPPSSRYCSCYCPICV